jgi:uridine kinase
MQLTDALFDLCKNTAHPIIAIDGPAGAGKTTLASHLAAALALRFHSNVIHLDDVYRGWDLALTQSLTQDLTSIIKDHQSGREITYRPFNWAKGEPGPQVTLPPRDLLILEGVGAAQSAIRPLITASIWIGIDPQHGYERVIARDGDAISVEMKKWLITQQQHFAAENTEKAADFALTN